MLLEAHCSIANIHSPGILLNGTVIHEHKCNYFKFFGTACIVYKINVFLSRQEMKLITLEAARTELHIEILREEKLANKMITINRKKTDHQEKIVIWETCYCCRCMPSTMKQTNKQTNQGIPSHTNLHYRGCATMSQMRSGSENPL